MIELFAAPTANGMKPAILLHLTGLEHRIVPVGLGAKEKPDGFAEASPTGRIPAIHDLETGVRLCESGAILIYLAEKAKSDLWPTGAARIPAMEWLFIACATFGPALGGAHHYLHFQKNKSDYAEARARADVARIYLTLERRLSTVPFLAGDALTLADVALWPFVARADWQGVDLIEYPATLRWYRKLALMDAFARGFDLAGTGQRPPLSD